MAFPLKQDLPAIYRQRYAPLNLPEYRFKEFPKKVKPPGGGKAVRVLTAEEELRVLAGSGIVREADDRALLITEARNKGVRIDDEWPLDRIREEIAEHDEAVALARASLAAKRAKREDEARKLLIGAPARAEAPEDHDDDKDRLVRLADAKGVKIDKRKNAEAIAEAIRAAGFDDAEAA